VVWVPMRTPDAAVRRDLVGPARRRSCGCRWPVPQ
jgi:hypothetical protein